MKAALEAFGAHPVTGHKYLVLGDMRSLGGNSRHYHEGLKDLVLATQPQTVFTYGTEMKALYDQLKNTISTRHHDDLDQLITEVISTLHPHDAVMIKASNSVNLNKLTQAITKKFDPSH